MVRVMKDETLSFVNWGFKPQIQHEWILEVATNEYGDVSIHQPLKGDLKTLFPMALKSLNLNKSYWEYSFAYLEEEEKQTAWGEWDKIVQFFGKPNIKELEMISKGLKPMTEDKNLWGANRKMVGSFDGGEWDIYAGFSSSMTLYQGVLNISVNMYNTNDETVGYALSLRNFI